MFRRIIQTGLLYLALAVSGAAWAQDDTDDVEASPPPPPCGTRTIEIADLRWPSATILAHIHARLLEDHLDCSVEIVAGDNAATASAMALTQSPAVAPELWVTRIPDIWNAALEAGTLVRVGNSFGAGALEGWFVPGFAADADPAILTPEGVREAARRALDGGNRMRFVTCPIDWACSVVNANLLRLYGLDGLVELVRPASRFEMDRVLSEAISRRETILFYYWQPNASLSQFDFRPVELDGFDPDAFPCMAQVDCPNLRATGFPTEPVVVALSDWVLAEAPGLVDYLQRATMPLEIMNQLLAIQSESGLGAAETADRFVESFADVWEPWVAETP